MDDDDDVPAVDVVCGWEVFGGVDAELLVD